jgi:hypothetical protein
VPSQTYVGTRLGRGFFAVCCRWSTVVDMYLRETKPRRRDGSGASYLALAPEERDRDGLALIRLI